MSKTRTIKVDYLARVEGEGAMYVKVRGGKVEDVKLRIFEPPRYFEAFMRGRDFREAPDITARICGICPVAYQMSAVHAMEDALGASIPPHIRELRRLLYCGEWIESHTLHIYMLHAPDFLGYESAIHMAKDHAEVVKKGLELKKTGNEIVSVLGGREIHPINVRVGGFYKLPPKARMADLAEKLKRARDLALETVQWSAKLEFPDFEQPYEFVSLKHPDEYPFNEGRIVSSQGLDIPVREYDANFREIHVKHSNALQSVLRGKDAYFVGPQARYALNFELLPESVRQAAEQAGLGRVCRNPFQSIVVRAIEVLFSCEEALRVLANYDEKLPSGVDLKPRPGSGCAATEAPRGLIYHRYRIDGEGRIAEAKIVPPTSQNQKRIEEDLLHLVPQFLELSQEKLTWKCEQAIRNYDPCISCATHFLKLDLDSD